MPIENESNNSIIPSGSNGLIRVQHSIEITNKILKERDNRLVQSDYESVKIGNQSWMIKNLNVDRFRNGDLIPEVKSNEDWKTAGLEGKPAWCYYDNNPEYGKIYGKLYNWHAVNDPRGLAPNGWYIPSDKEWKQLADCLGGEIYGRQMKSIYGWSNQNKNTNDSGFSALPAGFRYYYAQFRWMGSDCVWWCSNEKDARTSMNSSLDAGYDFLGIATGQKGSGNSIRCLKS